MYFGFKSKSDKSRELCCDVCNPDLKQEAQVGLCADGAIIADNYIHYGIAGLKLKMKLLKLMQ